jgi:D-glycero-D-manno-heptose 1,7-bisphosphate phosphatase
MALSKAIFLDRDGVINREQGDYTYLLEEFKINEGVLEALEIFYKAGYLLIVISNQSGVAKGLYTTDQVDYLNLHFERKLNARGIKLTEFYFCPHHPTVSRCLCRKPDSLMLEKAIARFQIDPRQSYFIGDAVRDKEAGDKVGLNTILIRPNSSLMLTLDQIPH